MPDELLKDLMDIEDAPTTKPPALMKVAFFGVRPSGITTTVNFRKVPIERVFAVDSGICYRITEAPTGGKGIVVFWGDVLNQLRAALPASPEMRAALRTLLEEAEAT